MWSPLKIYFGEEVNTTIASRPVSKVQRVIQV